MRRFGYLEPAGSDAESLYHESAIVEALRQIQKYGAINQTGMLDNETLEVSNCCDKPHQSIELDVYF